jgi:glycerol-3-phosphate dehydrogenase (NAD(P)+)
MKVAILGGGSWAIALGNLLCAGGQAVSLWEYERDTAHMLDKLRKNRIKLPGVALLPEVQVGWELDKIVIGADYVFVALPSWVVSSTLGAIRASVGLELLKEVRGWVIASRGIELHGLELMSEVFGQVMPAALHGRQAVLAGPAFAEQVCLGQACRLVAAGEDEQLTERIASLLSRSPLRIDTSADPRGVQIAACFCDVVSIAAGFGEGLGYGENVREALVRRAVEELVALGVALGGRAETFADPGLGRELTQSCTGAYSPNRLVGLHMGHGKSLSEAIYQIPKVVEGLDAAIAINSLANKLSIDMPIARTVYEVLFQRTDPFPAVKALMTKVCAGKR